MICVLICILSDVLSQPFVNQFETISSEIQKDPLVESNENIKVAPVSSQDEASCDEEQHETLYESSVENEDMEKDFGSDDNIEQIFVKDETSIGIDRHDLKNIFEESDYSQDSQEDELNDNDSESESDNDMYEIANGVHITADTDNNAVQQLNITRDKPNSLVQTRILKVQKQSELNNAMQLKNKTSFVPRSTMLRKLLVPQDFVEKENMVQCNIKANPRSVLKKTQVLLKQEAEQEEKKVEDEKFEKRFAKSKEMIRAKLFQNFIAQTKIIHAPVRRERLPRKQVIQPVARTDEEIIVQEVIVPSNGITETKPEKFIATETIQLSDTDEDYDPSRSNKIKRKTKKKKPQIEIVITDSESEESVISINYSDSDIETIIVDNKRKRGRPPKNKSLSEESDIPVKRGRGRPPTKANKTRSDNANGNDNDADNEAEKEKEIETQKYNTRKRSLSKTEVETSDENKCTKCTKSFPSSSSLKTHMQFHNLKESNNKRIKNFKHNCDKCSESFVNIILLNRHKTNVHTADESSFTCNICKKKFSDNTQLTNHKRSHLKEQMFKSSVTVNVTPRKFIKKPSTNQYKCSYCGRILASAILLSSHIKNHSRFNCNLCKSSFISKFMLHNHVSKDCIAATKTTPEKKKQIVNVKKESDKNASHSSNKINEPKQINKTPPKRKSTAIHKNLPKTKISLRSSTVLKRKSPVPDVIKSRKSMYNTRSANSGFQLNSNLRKKLVQMNK